MRFFSAFFQEELIPAVRQAPVFRGRGIRRNGRILAKIFCGKFCFFARPPAPRICGLKTIKALTQQSKSVLLPSKAKIAENLPQVENSNAQHAAPCSAKTSYMQPTRQFCVWGREGGGVSPRMSRLIIFDQ